MWNFIESILELHALLTNVSQMSTKITKSNNTFDTLHLTFFTQNRNILKWKKLRFRIWNELFCSNLFKRVNDSTVELLTNGGRSKYSLDMITETVWSRWGTRESWPMWLPRSPSRIPPGLAKESFRFQWSSPRCVLQDFPMQGMIKIKLPI